jgi:hypothetical protein
MTHHSHGEQDSSVGQFARLIQHRVVDIVQPDIDYQVAISDRPGWWSLSTVLPCRAQNTPCPDSQPSGDADTS